jgi:hypothetical protein
VRLRSVAAATLMLAITGPAAAQDWTEFVSRDDRFSINFPGQPRVTDTTYKSQFGADLPARVYGATQGSRRFSMTVVDYRPIEKILTERAKACPPGAETCLGSSNPTSSTGAGYWKADVSGAIVYATSQFLQRDGKVTQLIWSNIDLVEGHMLTLTNTDKSRTVASIFMHENKLYIAEATVPAGDPEPGIFQQSLGWIDEAGKSIRYQSIYRNGFPPPPRTR